jgi:hypothetical protein
MAWWRLWRSVTRIVLTLESMLVLQELKLMTQS